MRLCILRLILSGNPLPENSGDYIHQAAESAELSFEFDVQLHQETCAVYYQAQLERCGSSSANISKEKLSCRIYPVPVRGVSDDLRLQWHRRPRRLQQRRRP